MIIFVLSVAISVGFNLDIYWPMQAVFGAMLLGCVAYIAFSFTQQPSKAVFKTPLVPLIPARQ